jgi:hypothetical protein
MPVTAGAGRRDWWPGCRYWTVMGRTGAEPAPPAPAASGWPVVGTVAAYAAAAVAFAYALVSLYWAVGGRGLLSTVGGYVEQFARRGGAVPVLVALAATAAKVAGGLLALALVRPWGLALGLRPGYAGFMIGRWGWARRCASDLAAEAAPGQSPGPAPSG